MKWVRVEDYLPDPYQNVMIYGTGVASLYMIGYMESDGSWVTIPSAPRKITHWMPLPDPPVGRTWVSVKDSVPDYGVDVLVCNFAGNIFKGHRRKSKTCGEWVLGDATHQVAADRGHIYYWQPLPEFIQQIEEQYNEHTR